MTGGMKMNRVSIACVLLLIGLLLNGVQSGFAQAALTQIEGSIQQAKQQGVEFLSTKDEKQKKAAKKNLDESENQLKKLLKETPNCERCLELLVNTYLFQAYFGFSKDYDECIKTASDGLTKFPANGRLAYFRGYAYYNSMQYAETNKSLKAALPNVDQPTVAQITQILQMSQQAFLTNWNRQANYYQSKESRIEQYNPQTFRNEVAFQVTPDFELLLGANGFAALTNNAVKVNDPEIQTYLEKLVTRIISKSPGSSFNNRVTLVNSADINAVTPPGHIIVYTGLLAFAENEAQLAGVLSHELAHNYGHHQARAVIKNYHAQSVANAVLRAINPQNATAQILGQLGANIGLTLFSRAYSRFEEKEADHYGAHLMFNAGYSPLDASSFFLKMSKAGGKQTPKFLSTHPPLLDRANYLMDYLESFPADGREFRVDSEEFKRIKARLAPAGQQQGAPGRGVLPPQ
ncbi:MAG: M48 family metalloprotease [Pyrinomonadaceae bacterium]